ncbi:MAG TPA: hypothetical protein VKG01_13385 [Thermoanaerobaculia bacterium]|nr:hypothetical protein [Thermoanaerobaculia bacterium]
MAFVRKSRAILPAFVFALAALLSGAGGVLLGLCGPFTDVAADAFCPFVLEIFYLSITTGTTATTYDPTSSVTRLQMAAFLSRTVDRTLQRGSHRAALNQFWTTEQNAGLAVTTVGSSQGLPVSDGEDVWLAASGAVWRVHGSDGKLLQTWTGATAAFGTLSAMGRIFATGSLSPGALYQIDPSQPAGVVTTVATNLGSTPRSIAYDGSRIWTANFGGSVSIVIPGAVPPWTVTTVAVGAELAGALFDGSNIWVTDFSSNTLLKLNGSGAVLQTVTVGGTPQFPAFDGSNIWVPNLNGGDSVTVVHASSGAILATLTGNGLKAPSGAAFDGQHVLVTSRGDPGDAVSLWKAADLTPIGSVPMPGGTSPYGACSDGVHFWISMLFGNVIARF